LAKVLNLRFAFVLWVLIWTGLQLVPLPQTIKLAAYLSGCRPFWLPVGLDKVVHFFGYAAWALLATLALRTVPLPAAAAIGFSSGALHGLAMELIQARLSFRMGDPLDWATDLLGLLAGAALAVFVRKGTQQSAVNNEEPERQVE